MSAHYLHSNRQAVRVETDREGQPRYARQVGRQGKHVFQVHGQWVVAVLAQAEGGRGGDRGSNHVDGLESPVSKSASDQRAHLLRLPVISIVIAGGQGISAQHDAPLDLRTEPFRRVS